MTEEEEKTRVSVKKDKTVLAGKRNAEGERRNEKGKEEGMEIH